MSVFADFQRMWLKRFPDNSLSSEWEDDVRVSLQRHKQKVVDLSKELEQEMLYVEYLERLLSDVEEFRKAGGDPAIPIQRLSEDDDSIDKQTEKSDDISSTTNDEHTSTSVNGNGSGGEKLQATDRESSEFANSMAAIRNKVEKLNQSRDQGTLHHHQCIDELTLHLRNAQIKNADDTKVTSPTRSETPTSFVTVIEVKDPSPIPTNIATSQTTTSISIAEQPEIKDDIPVAAPEKTEDTNTSPVQNVEIRRKIPPRPPPKVARRVGPIADSPTTIIETPASPSNTGHAVNTPTRSNNQSTTSSDSNVKPSEFLRHKNSDEKLPPVLLKHPQNITKSAQNSSSESLINNTTNEETLHVESFPISERIKSYESISSLSSDGLKAAAAANNTSTNSSHGANEHETSGGHIDTEPYYDTVPIEETDDEIEAEDNDFRVSSLPRVLESQLSVDSGQVGERVSNYINIDYFLSQNRKLRDSSNESDDELDAGTSSPPPQPRSTIDDTKNVLPSQIKAVAHVDSHRNVQIRNIIGSIITSETFYVECLTKMLHNGSGGEKLQATDRESSEFANSMAAIRNKVEKLNQSRDQGTLHHHQCIDELTLHLRNAQIKNADDTKVTSPTRSETPTSFVTVIEVKDPSPIPTNIATSQTTTSISIAEQPEIKDDIPVAAPEKTEDRNTSPVQNVEIRRKIPPRPPPKVARRVGPIADSPTTIIETPASPSNTGHAVNTPTRSNNQSTTSSDSNVKPSEFLRHKNSDEKLPPVLLKHPQNITKSAQNSSSESLINNTTNEETLHVESFPISERIKSYESISSLSSDGLKAAAAANNTSTNSSHGANEHETSGGHIDTEPYYDTVPIEETDDEIEAEDNDFRVSSLPRVLESQLSVDSGQVGERVSNYINIDYFLSQNRKLRDSSNESDDELDAGTSSPPPQPRSTIDDTKNVLPSQIKAVAHVDSHRNVQINSLQYMKAMAATLTTSRPVISRNELQTMFFKVEELHEAHTEFLTSLKNKIAMDAKDIHIGEPFEELAKHVHIYGAFLHNYGQAIDTVKKCGENNIQFKEIVSKIVLNSQNEQLLTIEDLLHKPVARLQKNALVLQDLINETPSTHADYKPLIQSQKTMHKLLSEFNVVQNKTSSEDKALRRLVKNSFIVELADGHRKLRHLFLFNDVIACAKYKASRGDRFEFDLKWFISLKDIFIPSDDFVLRSPSASTITNPLGIDAKENNPSNLLLLKTQASAVRDCILSEERDDKRHKLYSSRSIDKYRKKLHDIEAQLVLASPNLVFRLGNKTTNKILTFFLSSHYERTQWIDTIINLQESCNLPTAQQVNLLDLQAWIAACQTFVKTEMGSYLMRNSRDESLLIGDLQLTIIGVSGFDKPSELFCCVEADSYGHYFHKATTKTPNNCVNPQWNENFLIELEGCQNMRFLLYEDTGSTRPMLRAEHVLRLSRDWLTDTSIPKSLKLSDTITLNIIVKFANEELQSSRVPATKPGPIFGVKIQQVLKREKRDIPFIVTACVREVERRGMTEVGIYRVSRSAFRASDLARLKKAFETNNYEAEQLLKDVDIHSVTGIFKAFLRELPETLFTDILYRRFIETFNKFSNINENELSHELQKIFADVPPQSKTTINFILDHLLRIHQQESENKMSLHNLAMVFGPTLLRLALNSSKQKDQLETSTVDVMAQAGILYCFLQARKN